jgi:restriction endonuclease S subunit
MAKISNENQKLELILPSLGVVDQILNIFKEIDDNQTLNKQKKNPQFMDAIRSFNDLYVIMCEKLSKESNQQNQLEKLQTF